MPLQTPQIVWYYDKPRWVKDNPFTTQKRKVNVKEVLHEYNSPKDDLSKFGKDTHDQRTLLETSRALSFLHCFCWFCIYCLLYFLISLINLLLNSSKKSQALSIMPTSLVRKGSWESH